MPWTKPKTELSDGYTFTRTALGQFAVRRNKESLACVRISKGEFSAERVPFQVVLAAMERWESLPDDLKGCVPKGSVEP